MYSRAIALLFICGTFAAHAENCSQSLRISFEKEAHLTPLEVTQIQGVVDRIQRDLVVIGSAARAERRNRDIDLPMGKGPNKKSDIDYILPVVDNFETDEAQIFLEGYRA